MFWSVQLRCSYCNYKYYFNIHGEKIADSREKDDFRRAKALLYIHMQSIF